MAQVSSDMTIEQAIAVDEGIAQILMTSGMHCLGCMMASGETLGEAALVHGIDETELITKINDFLKAK